MHRRCLLFALALSLAACGGGEPIPVEQDGEAADTVRGDVASFGADDTRCPSLTLNNEADDEQIARAASLCVLDALGAGVPVVWDVSIPTVEGDPIYHRFDFAGADVVIVRDDRADTFGSGSVRAERCAAIEARDAEWLPVGVDCEPIDHPGFAEAAPG